MNKIILIISLFAISLISASGKVTFNLIFTDPEGVGFNYRGVNQYDKGNKWMVNEARYAAELLGDIIEQDAHINVEVKSNPEISYGQATGDYWHVVKEGSGKKAILKAHYKILNEITKNDRTIDAKIEFNISKFSKINRHLFRTTVIHELTHELGFGPWKMRDHNSKYYNDYDKLLHDGKGNWFLVGKSKLTINPKFDISSGLYACGPNIHTMNQGRCVKIHSPAEYKCGSSYSHLDSDEHPRSLMQYKDGDNDHYIWDNYELGVMQDLGYKINWNAYSISLKKLYPSYFKLFINKYNFEESDAYFKFFTEQDPSYEELESITDYLWSLFLEDE